MIIMMQNYDDDDDDVDDDHDGDDDDGDDDDSFLAISLGMSTTSCSVGFKPRRCIALCRSCPFAITEMMVRSIYCMALIFIIISLFSLPQKLNLCFYMHDVGI